MKIQEEACYEMEEFVQDSQTVKTVQMKLEHYVYDLTEVCLFFCFALPIKLYNSVAITHVLPFTCLRILNVTKTSDTKIIQTIWSNCVEHGN